MKLMRSNEAAEKPVFCKKKEIDSGTELRHRNVAPPNLPGKSTTEKYPKLLDQVRGKIRLKHYSYRTEQT